MKWPLIVSIAGMSATYFLVAIPAYLSLKNAAPLQNSAPSSAAFIVAIPYALIVGAVLFAAVWGFLKYWKS